MSVKDKLIDSYIEVGWNIVLSDDFPNKQKVRMLNNIIYDDIRSIDELDKAGVW